VVLCGLSAGSLCWFSEAVTAFHGPPQRVPGLGLLPYSNCVHYDGERARRDSYHHFLSEGMPPGYAAGDGAALHFCGESLARVVSSRPKASAYWVEEVGGGVSEVALQVRWLGGSRTLTAA
jgi:peptidase E